MQHVSTNLIIRRLSQCKGDRSLSTSRENKGFVGLSLPGELGRLPGGRAFWQPLLGRLTCLERINQVYAQAAAAADQWEFLAALLQTLQVDYQVDEGDWRRIPSAGPLVVVANHPFGGVEGIILPALLGQVRRDVKLVANYLLRQVAELHDLFIYVDPFGTHQSPRASLAGLREAVAWLQQGGVVAIFPAGEVSHLHWSTKTVTDPVWSPTVAWLLRKSRAAVLPVFFAGHNGPLFQVLGLLHPLVRTLLLPREALNKSGRTIQVKIGQVIAPTTLDQVGDAAAVTDYLRLRTYLLQGHFAKALRLRRLHPLPQTRRLTEQIMAPVAAGELAQEVNRLPASQLLLASGSQRVYWAEAGQIPRLLQELGRLREITFRKVGEGTGRALDLDRFDAHYRHLFVWNQTTQEVVGAYRIGKVDEILASHGRSGLYTATLFDFAPPFLASLQPALELGRSFVRPEYQKNYGALLLLWQGIGRLLVQEPHYRYLFGPVSISNAYSEFSQGLLATWLSMHTFLPELAQYIRPKNPFQLRPEWDKEVRLALAGTRGVEDLSALLADLNPQRQGVPVLLRHYLKLGGKILGFNRDPDFNNALDGLILVDLWQTRPAVLQRYMGKEGYLQFARQQGAGQKLPAVSIAGNAPQGSLHPLTLS